MRAVILLVSLALCYASNTKRDIVTLYDSLDNLFITSGTCSGYTHIIEDYRNAMHNFTIETYKRVALRGFSQFVMSPHSMWLTMAAIAEGADYYTQQQLFELLLLPSDPCIRQKYYELAASRFSFTTDAAVVNNRAMVIDAGVTPNPVWLNFVAKNSLLDVITAPIKYNPVAAANTIRQIVYADFPRLDLSGNSVLIDTMDYNGLWNTAFAGAVVRRAPFYSLNGTKIGAVDLMTVKRRAKIGFLKSLHSKILELPIGVNSQYTILMALVVENVDLEPIFREIKSSVITTGLKTLRETRVPIDIALPRFTINSELDAKTILEDLGITKLWTDPEATRYISTPPALPSSYVQRATLTLDTDGVNTPPIRELQPELPTSPEENFFSEFIANRPFMFGLFDTETYTCLMATMHTEPTYPN